LRRATLGWLGLLAACRQPDTPATPPNVPDSQFAPSAMIATFRERVPERPARLGGGATASVDSLLAGYVRAVAARDTAGMRALALTVSEFAWLYYLDSPMAQKPYELDPDVMGAHISAQSARGATRALDRFGGRSSGAWRSACAPARASGALRLHECTVSVAGTALRLSAVERDGRVKLVGLGTSL
jgi:hypothetical protein